MWGNDGFIKGFVTMVIYKNSRCLINNVTVKRRPEYEQTIERRIL